MSLSTSSFETDPRTPDTSYSSLRRSMSYRKKSPQIQNITPNQSLSRSFSLRYQNNKENNKPTEKTYELPPWQSIPLENDKPKKKDRKHWLDIGMNVLFNHEVGKIYINMGKTS